MGFGWFVFMMAVVLNAVLLGKHFADNRKNSPKNVWSVPTHCIQENEQAFRMHRQMHEQAVNAHRMMTDQAMSMQQSHIQSMHHHF